MKNTDKNLVTKRKTSTGKKVIKAIAIMVAINGGIKLFSMYSSKRSKQTDLPKGEYCYHFLMDGKQIQLGNDQVEKITLYAKMSGIDLDVSKVSELDGLRIDCKCFMSGVMIRVPEKVAVRVEAKKVLSTIGTTVPEYLDDSLPTIYITGNASLSGIHIRLMED